MGLFGRPCDPSLPPGVTYEDIDEQYEPTTCEQCGEEIDDGRLCPDCDPDGVEENENGD